MPRATRSRLPKICVIIPAFNEEDSIRQVIQKLKKLRLNLHLVVINDGSHDSTSEQVKGLGVALVELPFNLGIGGAVQTGLKYALVHGFEMAVQVDADGQHEPTELPKLLRAVNRRVDLVIGSRFIKRTRYHSSSSRLWGIRFFSTLIRMITGQTIYDPTSGYRVYNKRALSFLADNYPVDFPEPESIVYLLKNKFILKEVSVEMNERVTGQSSLRSLKAVYLVLSITLGILISAFKRNFVYVSNSR